MAMQSGSMDLRTDRSAAILRVVRSIPRGQVSTYGAVALRAGLPRGARLVGRVLSELPNGSVVPWHRVVAAGGRIAFAPGSRAHREQCARLAREGVVPLRGRIDLDRHGWHGPGGNLDRWLWQPVAPAGEGSRARPATSRAYDREPPTVKRRSG
jgi:methylated-DNA-protein-cysteine methyltransferase related protein